MSGKFSPPTGRRAALGLTTLEHVTSILIQRCLRLEFGCAVIFLCTRRLSSWLLNDCRLLHGFSVATLDRWIHGQERIVKLARIGRIFRVECRYKRRYVVLAFNVRPIDLCKVRVSPNAVVRHAQQRVSVQQAPNEHLGIIVKHT